MTDKWQELKEYINRQHEWALKHEDGSAAQRLLIGFWKAIKDKMWSIERNYLKGEEKP